MKFQGQSNDNNRSICLTTLADQGAYAAHAEHINKGGADHTRPRGKSPSWTICDLTFQVSSASKLFPAKPISSCRGVLSFFSIFAETRLSHSSHTTITAHYS